MQWRTIRLSARCALLAGAAAFALFFGALVLRMAGVPLDFFLLSLPLRFTQLITGWEVLAGWKLYTISFLIAPLYYAILGYFIGLLIEKLRKQK